MAKALDYISLIKPRKENFLNEKAIKIKQSKHIGNFVVIVSSNKTIIFFLLVILGMVWVDEQKTKNQAFQSTWGIQGSLSGFFLFHLFSKYLS